LLGLFSWLINGDTYEELSRLGFADYCRLDCSLKDTAQACWYPSELLNPHSVCIKINLGILGESNALLIVFAFEARETVLFSEKSLERFIHVPDALLQALGHTQIQPFIFWLFFFIFGSSFISIKADILVLSFWYASIRRANAQLYTHRALPSI
jgi:hypothetical protein